MNISKNNNIELEIGEIRLKLKKYRQRMEQIDMDDNDLRKYELDRVEKLQLQMNILKKKQDIINEDNQEIDNTINKRQQRIIQSKELESSLEQVQKMPSSKILKLKP